MISENTKNPPDVFERAGLRGPGEPVLLLAPMEGITNGVFRELVCAVGGVDLVATEFISISHNGTPDPRPQRHRVPLQFQFLAAHPKPLAAALRSLQDSGTLLESDWLDLNAGCPSRKVNGRGAGAALLKTPSALMAMLEAMRENHPGPLSVKMRLGYEHPEEIHELLLCLRDAPLDFVTIHARTRLDAKDPEAPLREEYLAQAVAAFPFPVIGNGEIWSVEDALRMIRKSGVRGVMCGRGAVANPYLFDDIRRALGALPGPNPDEHARQLLQFAEVLLRHYREMEGRKCCMIGAYKEFSRWFSRNPFIGAEFFERIKELNSLSAFHEVLFGEKSAKRPSSGASEIHLNCV